MDDVGVDVVERYGLDPNLTPGLMPNVEALMDQGVLFENAWSMPVCSPTRAALLTGKHSYRTGIGTVVGAGFSLLPSEITLPELLLAKAPAYASAAFGKWHLDRTGSPDPCPALTNGFDYFTGTNVPLKSAAELCNWQRTVCSQAGTTVAPSTVYMARQVFDDAIAWIQGRAGPWFCYLAPQAPFEIYHVPPTDLQSRVTGVPCTKCLTNQRACYEAALQAFDTKLGDLVTALGSGWTEDTTILLVGDNGTPVNVTTVYPSAMSKGSVFEGGVRVPFVIAGASVDPVLRNTRSSVLVNVADVYRTVATIAGVGTLPAGAGLDSCDLTPVLGPGGGGSQRVENYTEIFRPNGLGLHLDYKAAERDTTYKLVYDCVTASVLGLYDLQTDPLEMIDLSSPAPLPGTVAGDALLHLRDSLLRRATCAGDGAAPLVGSTHLAVGETRAILSWTTDENATSRVDFGTSPSYGTTLYDGSLVTDHLVVMGGLSSDTDHDAMLSSWDETGYLFSGDNLPFRTLPFAGLLPVSDPFGGPLNTSLWSFIDPLGDAVLTTTPTQVQIAVPASPVPHNATGGANRLPRLRQTVSDLDFEVEATFDSPLDTDYQSQGILVEQDASRVLRVELRFTAGATSVAAVSTRTGAPALLAVDVVPLSPPMTVRCTRVGDTFTVSWSLDRVVYTPLPSFTEPLIVSGVSVYAGCAGTASHNMLVDAFVETSAPPDALSGG